jgi:hypothetical protein
VLHRAARVVGAEPVTQGLLAGTAGEHRHAPHVPQTGPGHGQQAETDVTGSVAEASRGDEHRSGRSLRGDVEQRELPDEPADHHDRERREAGVADPHDGERGGQHRRDAEHLEQECAHRGVQHRVPGSTCGWGSEPSLDAAGDVEAGVGDLAAEVRFDAAHVAAGDAVDVRPGIAMAIFSWACGDTAVSRSVTMTEVGTSIWSIQCLAL